MNIRPHGKWKSVLIEDRLDSSDVDGFLGIEELTDYTLVRKKKNRRCETTVKNDVKSKSSEISENRNSKDYSKKRKRKIDDKAEMKIEAPKKKIKKSKMSYTSVASDEIISCDSKADVSSWNDLYVPSGVLDALSALGFTSPTPIQTLTLPSAIRDKLDIVGAAETGSGKTLAFGIPVIHRILESRDHPCDESKDDADNMIDVEVDHEIFGDDQVGCVKVVENVELPWEKEKSTTTSVKSLILTPTRELAIQVKNHLAAVVKNLNIKISVVVGGMSMDKQCRLLKKNPDIIVATPGRLWELIQMGNKQVCEIISIQTLVIDEADRMVERGHFAELVHILNLINSNKSKRQTFVFSATLTLVHEAPKRFKLQKKKVKMSQEEKIKALMEMVGMQSRPKIVDITKKVGTVETLTEAKINCNLDEKDFYLYYFLTQFPGRTLVFCNSIDCVRRLNSLFSILQFNPHQLHASMHQKQRLKNLERFSSNSESLLLATDVAARGLDIPGIEHVIHYQVPRTSETYVHRSGRTARASKEGLSVMLIEPQEVSGYRRMCRTLNRNEDLDTFPVNFELMSGIKLRVNLVREIDKLEHQIRKENSKNNWIQKTAKEMDIDVSDDDLIETEDQYELAKRKRKIKSLRASLQQQLKRKLSEKCFSGKYPTKSGALLVTKGMGKAVDTVKNERTKNRETKNRKIKKRRKAK